MSFPVNCISCHMCQNICFWIVHFCWEFLSEFPKHWYLLRHLFISVQFMRLGEPTLCVFLQFCTSSIVLLTSCVNTMHCVFQQCELLCICADIPWNLCTLPGWVSGIADRHQEGGKAWNQLLRFLTHHPHRIVEGNRATFKSDSSSATKNLLDKAVRLLVQQVQPVFLLPLHYHHHHHHQHHDCESKSAVWPGRDDQGGRQRPTWEIKRRTDRPTGRFAKIRETQQFVIVLNLSTMYLCSPTSKVI